MEYLFIIFFGLWFFIPAGVANVVPIFAAQLPILKKFSYPIDFGHSIGGQRILGDHKTIRGFVIGVIAGVGISYLQRITPFPFTTEAFARTDPLILGLLLSIGALTGDSIKSFFKRRVGIRSGKSWLLADQIDYILGAILFSSFYIALPLYLYGIIIVEWIIIHFFSSFVGYSLHLKKDPV